MFRYIKLKNYQSLVDLEVDFMNNATTPKKLIAVYGENGAGKTNFASAFFTLVETLKTRRNVPLLDKTLSEDINNPLFLDLIKYNFKDMKSIINKYKTIDSKENMVLEYGFKFNNKIGSYYLEMDDEQLVHEKLDFVLNKNVVNYFDISNEKTIINEEIFKDKKYFRELKEEVVKFWGKHTFLSLVLFDKEERNKSYVDSRINSNFKKLLSSFFEMKINIKDEKNMQRATFEIGDLSAGSIKLNDESKLACYEDMVNLFYTSLYSDIKKAYYKKEINDSRMIYKLYFKKNIYNEIKDVPFELESSGTKRLIKVLPYFLNAVRGNITVIDEIDTACHDILIDKLLKNIKNDIKGQLIITTHNTLLLEDTLEAKEAYIFNVNQDASKKLLSFDQFERIQPNLNKRKRYLEGMYGGVPYPMDIDFEELNETLTYD